MRLGAVVVCLAMCRSAVGTTIVAVWTPSEVVIAADSMVSGGRDFAVKGETCKIRLLGPTVFASAGFVANLPLQVDVYRIAEESVADSPREHAERFATRFIAEMGRVVRWAKEHEPEAWVEYQRNECFQAVFAGVENETPVLLLRTFRCAADFQGRPFVIRERSLDCPGDCDPAGLRYLPLGTARSERPPVTFWREHKDVATAVRLLVEEQMKANPDRVGGSVSVVRVRTTGLACVACPPPCQGLQ
jgi:hypothetical protein